jgi:hypothetical protein
MPKAFAIEPRIASELRALGHFVTPPRSRPIQVRNGSVHSVPHSRNSIILLSIGARLAGEDAIGSNAIVVTRALGPSYAES